MPELQGVGHVALTVTDPKQSADFYNRLFDAQTVLTVEDDIGPLTICASPAMMFGFRTHPSTGEADRFDPARVGLDHLGFHVADRQQLEAWRVRLDEQGVANSGIIEDENGLHGRRACCQVKPTGTWAASPAPRRGLPAPGALRIPGSAT